MLHTCWPRGTSRPGPRPILNSQHNRKRPHARLLPMSRPTQPAAGGTRYRHMQAMCRAQGRSARLQYTIGQLQSAPTTRPLRPSRATTSGSSNVIAKRWSLRQPHTLASIGHVTWAPGPRRIPSRTPCRPPCGPRRQSPVDKAQGLHPSFAAPALTPGPFITQYDLKMVTTSRLPSTRLAPLPLGRRALPLPFPPPPDAARAPRPRVGHRQRPPAQRHVSSNLLVVHFP